MRPVAVAAFILIAATATATATPQFPSRTMIARLESPGGPLPFELAFVEREGAPAARIFNGPECIDVPIESKDGELHFRFDHYDARIEARVVPGPISGLEGTYRKLRRPVAPDVVMPFRASVSDGERFPRDPILHGHDPEPRPERIYRVRFDGEEDDAVLRFTPSSRSAYAVDATVLTTTGDYRFLAGTFDGDRLRLSVFDGAHAFLFDATVDGAGEMRGTFWSGSTWRQSFTARPDDGAAIRDAWSMTKVTSVPLDDIEVIDLESRARRLGDAIPKGQPTLLVLFGSWCPNCHDEAEFIRELDERYRARGLAIIGLAFEHGGGDSSAVERDLRQVRRFAERHRLSIPLYLAGSSDKARASQSALFIDRVRAFPTTLFFDASRKVRAIYTGYSGPATGEEHARLVTEWHARIEGMLKDAAPLERR